MKKSRMLVLLMIFTMIFSQMSFASTVLVGGKSKSLETMTVNARTYVSAKSLGDYGLSTAIKGDKITLSNHAVKFEFTNKSNAVKVNGVLMTMDSKALIQSGQAYYPLRFVFETMNYTVGFDKTVKKTTLNKKTDDSYPVWIKDGVTQYRFTSPAKKIVSLAPSITEILFAIGAEDRLVGRTKYCDYPVAATKVRSVGSLYEPDIEGILDIKPDMVIAATHMNEDAMKLFKKAGIRTATQKSPEKMDQIYELIENLGILTEQDYPARALVSTLRSKAQRVENIVNQIPLSKRATSYYVVGTGKSEYTAGSDTFIHDLFTKAGAKNVAADVKGWAYTLEKLLDHNPEYIFGESWAMDTMKGSKNYGALNALKNGKFVVVDANVFSRPGPRAIDQGLKQVLIKLYPAYAKQLGF